MIEQAEVYPKSEEWGVDGFTFTDTDAAFEKLREICRCVRPDRTAAGDTFDAMEMQSVPIHEAFYKGRFLGNRRQMPMMQKYGVYSNSLRRLATRPRPH